MRLIPLLLVVAFAACKTRVIVKYNDNGKKCKTLERKVLDGNGTYFLQETTCK